MHKSKSAILGRSGDKAIKGAKSYRDISMQNATCPKDVRHITERRNTYCLQDMRGCEVTDLNHEEAGNLMTHEFPSVLHLNIHKQLGFLALPVII